MVAINKRVEKIKRKYGIHAFQRWGFKGGNPVLLAQREGRVRIIKK